jgi:hypothetical protein
MSDALDAHTEMYVALVRDIDPAEDVDITKTKVELVSKFANSFPDHLAPEPEPEPVPTTRLGRFWHGCKQAAKSDNFGTGLKVLGGVVTTGLVVGATIKRDHHIEREAFQQMNQKL